MCEVLESHLVNVRPGFAASVVREEPVGTKLLSLNWLCPSLRTNEP